MIKKKGRRGDEDDDDNGFAGWGGYMAAKKAKLEDQYLARANGEGERKSDIFKGVAIFVNGYTAPTADELKRIMMVHGGIYHHYESHSTTHIIASNLPDTKVKQLKTLNVVKPAWIVDSLAAGCLLDYKKYLLYSNHTKSQPRLNFAQHSVASAASSKDSMSLSKSKVNVQDTPAVVRQLNKGNSHCTNDHVPTKLGLFMTNKDCAEPQSSSKTNNDKSKISDCIAVPSPSKERNTVASRRTAVEPEFLSEFYGNSRLHHLSTMGAMFKDYVARLREGSQGEFPGVKRLAAWKGKNGSNGGVRNDDDFADDLMDETFGNVGNKQTVQKSRTVMHIDMDCFFVSVGLRNRPELRGFPVAVTHAKGNTAHAREGVDRQYERDFYKQRAQNRIKQKQNCEKGDVEEFERKSRMDDLNENDSLSEIASCNYEARKAGVKNGMFFGAAVKLCPELKTIPYDFEGYKEVSYKLYDTLASYTLEIEAVSCDEMYVDCTEVLKKTNVTALEFASFLRKEIKDATGCTASAGFGSNPLQARLATKKAKPNGQFHLLPSDVERFMHNIKVEDLPGVGYSLAYRLQAEGIATCRDLQRLSLATLQKKFGTKTGEALHRHGRGEDNRALDVRHQRKSVSAEVNYGIRFTTQKEAEAFLLQLAGEVVSRMKQAHVRGRQVTLKLMVRAKDAPVETAKFMGHGACDNVSRSSSLGSATDDANIIYREVVNLERLLKIPPCELRGVGIQMSRLTSTSASGAGRNNLLTNFLGIGKVAKEKEKKGEPEERVEVPCRSKEAGKEQNADVKMSSESRCGSFGSETMKETKRKTKEIAKKDALDDRKTECLENIDSLTEKNLKESDMVSKHNSAGKEIGADSNKKSCNAAANKDGHLPVLTPPIEVPMMTLAQARKLIRAWVLSEVSPQNCDVVMFASYIQRLVLARRLEDVDILYSLLYRLLLNKGKSWKTAYKNIVKNTQTIMQAVYGADLKVPEFDK